MNNEQRKLVEKFFKIFPPTHALVRANEAMAIKSIDFKSPILDLGCGDGKFALLTLGQKNINTGLDPNSKETEKAKRSKAYKNVVVSNGASMPFKKEEFNTIIANSVLEHVEELEQVLKEVQRLLSRNGMLILTVPTPLVSRYFFWSKIIPGWANLKTKLWNHLNYFGEDEWKKRLKKAGFKVAKIEKTNSKSAIYWADIFFPLFPFGPLRFVLPFLEKRKVFGPSKDGATLLIVALKNERKNKN